MNEKLEKILFEPRQDTIPEAILADIIDWFPITGIISNVLKINNAKEENDKFGYKLQSGNLGLKVINSILALRGKGIFIPSPMNTILTIDKKT